MSAPAAAPPPTEVDFEQLYQQAPCGYLLTGDDGSITGVNDTFLRWTGHRRPDLLGTRLHRLMPPGDQILYSTHFMAQLQLVNAVTEMALDVIGEDGERRAALLSASRTPGTDTSPAVVRVIIFSAQRRRRYERELVDALRGAEQSDARRAHAEAGLQHLVHHDPLTGLFNRAGLTRRLDGLLAEGGVVAGHRLGVLFLDLDNFKAVNDSLGHAAGDRLLVIVAQRLRAAVRESTIVARLAGDEFVIVDPVVDTDHASHLALRLLNAVNAPVVIEGLEVVTSASIGAAVADGEQDTAERLLRRADLAMYRAKARGRNSWELHDPRHVDPAVDRLRLLGELRQGIDRGELRLHYQPQVDLQAGLLSGVEALVRWQHPVRGLLGPVEFIEVAEESGLVRRLGAWVLEEAVAQAVRWARDASADLPVGMAVNLSARQLSDPDIVAHAARVLREQAIEPARLTLEITETALVQDPEAALVTLMALKALGVRLSVDDFGTGYASLTYLQRFPVDELKIDRSFVANLCKEPGAHAIVAACVQLAHAVGIRAVAEGVETQRQHAALIDLNCDLAQGYHYTRPLPVDALTTWLDERG